MAESASEAPRLVKKRHVAFGALITTVIAVIGIVIAYSQLHLADMQNKVGNQESLVLLVTDIAQQTRAMDTAPASQTVFFDEARYADAAQGFALINALHSQVPAIDNYEVGVGFQGEFGYHDALISYDRAAAGSPWPETDQGTPTRRWRRTPPTGDELAGQGERDLAR